MSTYIQALPDTIQTILKTVKPLVKPYASAAADTVSQWIGRDVNIIDKKNGLEITCGAVAGAYMVFKGATTLMTAFSPLIPSKSVKVTPPSLVFGTVKTTTNIALRIVYGSALVTLGVIALSDATSRGNALLKSKAI